MVFAEEFQDVFGGLPLRRGDLRIRMPHQLARSGPQAHQNPPPLRVRPLLLQGKTAGPREVYPVYTATPDLPAPKTLPERLGLRPNFGLVRLAAPTSVSWSGGVAAITGAFSGTLTLPAPSGASSINGVLSEDVGTDSGLIGAGLIKIPLTGVGVPRGSYETAGIRLRNEAGSPE